MKANFVTLLFTLSLTFSIAHVVGPFFKCPLASVKCDYFNILAVSKKAKKIRTAYVYILVMLMGNSL